MLMIKTVISEVSLFFYFTGIDFLPKNLTESQLKKVFTYNVFHLWVHCLAFYRTTQMHKPQFSRSRIDDVEEAGLLAVNNGLLGEIFHTYENLQLSV